MPLVACRTLSNVSDGSRDICLNQQVPGRGMARSFAEYALAKASIAYKLAEGTPCELCVLAERLAVGVHAYSARRGSSRGCRCWCSAGGTDRRS